MPFSVQSTVTDNALSEGTCPPGRDPLRLLLDNKKSNETPTHWDCIQALRLATLYARYQLFRPTAVQHPSAPTIA